MLLVVGCAARSEARTQGVPIAVAIGATEDAASGRAAWPDGIALFRQTLLARFCLSMTTERVLIA
jgi:hypothetical protein